jgi:hypothetical protein
MPWRNIGKMPTGKQSRRKKEENYKSPFEPIEDVARAAEECRRLIAQGVITLELRYPDEVQFRIDEEKYRGLGKTEVENRKFRTLLGDEVTKGLVSALTGDIWRSFPPPQVLDVPHQGHDKYKAEAEAIKERVGAVLCDEELRAWHQIRTTAKIAVLQTVEWEVNLKKAERKSGAVENIPHALVRFCVQEPKAARPAGFQLFFFPPLSGSEEGEYYVLDMHERDIRRLIADLTRIVAALETVRVQQ